MKSKFNESGSTDHTLSENRTEQVPPSKNFLEDIFKTSSDGVIITAEKGLITMVNQAFEKMLGYSRDEIIGKLVRDFVPTDDVTLKRSMEMITRLREEGFITFFEMPYIKKDGSTINLEVSAMYLRDENDTITGSVAVYHDITVRKPAGLNLKNPEQFKEMIAADSSMAQIFRQAEAAASTDYNLIITGESGTGKEVLARIVHKVSGRASEPFIAVNMASFNQTLFEGSFFGHEKGAFTGANTEKKGLFEAAHKGTLFLDEITEMDISLQAKLLRAIQEKEIMRVGGTQSKTFDVRFIVATNCDLNEAIQKKRFREDLYFRLNMFHIHIPPLRERKKDIYPLAEYFLPIHAQINKKNITGIAADLREKLTQYTYPGNVRELESIIAKAVVTEETNELTLSSVSHIHGFSDSDLQDATPCEPLVLKEVEKNHIKSVLKLTGGNRTHAAKMLGIALRTLQRKIIVYDL